MQNLINYVSSVLNIKIDNPLVIADMELELHKIDNLVAYREYIRENFNKIEYKTGFQLFIILTNQYQSIEEMASLPHDLANSFSKELANKVEEARVFLKNELEVGNDKPFSKLTRSGEKFFNPKELKALSELGSAVYLVALAEERRLEDELVKLFLNKYKQKAKYESLTDGQKRIQAVIGGRG